LRSLIYGFSSPKPVRSGFSAASLGAYKGIFDITELAFKNSNIENEVVVARDGAEALDYLRNLAHE